MRKVKLLKSYEGYGTGEIIAVSNNVAFGLVDRGVAVYPEVKDFLHKPESIPEAQTKAFNQAPNSRVLKKRLKN